MAAELNIEFSWHDLERNDPIEVLLVLVARQTLEKCKVNNGNAGLVITSDKTIRELNKIHRGLDEITDVLSFSNNFEGQYYGENESLKTISLLEEFVLPPGQPENIGEVVVCLPQAMRQAGVGTSGIRLELSKLVAHGFLHLLGYDHIESQDRELMEQLEADILNKVGHND